MVEQSIDRKNIQVTYYRFSSVWGALSTWRSPPTPAPHTKVKVEVSQAVT
jgi:hypothetical protein